MAPITHPVYERAINGKDLTALGEIFSLPAESVVEHTPSILQGIRDVYKQESYGNSDSVSANHPTLIESCLASFMVIAQKQSDLVVDNLETFNEMLLELNSYPKSDTYRTNLLKSLLNVLQMEYTKMKVVKGTVDNAIKCLGKDKDDSVNQTISGMFSMAASQHAKFFAPHATALTQFAIDNISGCRSNLLSLINTLYPFAREAIHPFIPKLMKIYENGDAGSSISVVQIFSNVAKKNPELLEKYIDDFIPALTNQMTGTMVALMTVDLAVRFPLKFSAYLDDFKMATEANQYMIYNSAKIYGIVGRTTIENGEKCMTLLMEALKTSTDQNSPPVLLLEVKNVGGVFKSLLDPHIEYIKSFIGKTSNEGARQLAQHIVDYYENRSLQSLGEALVEQGAKVDVAVKQSTEAKVKVDEIEKRVDTLEQQLKDIDAYVEKHIDELKEFVAGIVKKLPVPMDFTTEDRFLKVQKVLVLHFQCACKGSNCLYSGSKTFRTETKVINKWIRVAFSALQVGKALWDKDLAGAISGLKTVYDAANTQYDSSFSTFITQPFLTSEESDELINQLRDAKFFDHFGYNAKLGNWCCFPCNNPAAPASPASTAIASTASNPDPDPAPPSLKSSASQTSYSAPAQLSGILFKKGSNILSAWQPRVFDIDENAISHKRQNSNVVRRSIPFNTVLSVSEVHPRVSGRPFTFQIVTEAKIHLLAAENEDQYKLWYNAVFQGVRASKPA